MFYPFTLAFWAIVVQRDFRAEPPKLPRRNRKEAETECQTKNLIGNSNCR